MKNKKFFIIGAAATAVLGTLLHFVYKWSGGNTVAAIFSAVNESTFEHLKLLFWPFFISSSVGYFLFRENRRSYIFSSALALLSGLFTIVSVFYTYTALIGRNLSFVDIVLFFVSVIVSFFLFYCFYKSGLFCGKFFDLLGALIYIILIILFVWFTFNPPETPVFLDPVDKFYGIPS